MADEREPVKSFFLYVCSVTPINQQSKEYLCTESVQKVIFNVKTFPQARHLMPYVLTSHDDYYIGCFFSFLTHLLGVGRGKWGNLFLQPLQGDTELGDSW